MKYLLAALSCVTITSGLLSAQDSAISTTFSALPDYNTGNGSAARINTVTLTTETPVVHAKPGETVGWGFKINWTSNAGDRLSFNSSTCIGDMTPVSNSGYVDLIGQYGGNQNGSVAANTTWETPFVPSTQGIGYVTIRPDAVGGAQFFGEIRLTFSLRDNSSALGNFIGSSSILIPIVIIVDEPDPTPPADQVITFSPLSDKTVGDEPFTLTATSSSGLPVEIFSIYPNICSVSGNTVTIHQAGTCTFMVEQEGNNAFNPAVPVFQTIEIAKKTATLDLAASVNRSYTGSGQFISVNTTPASLPVTILYDGSTTPPVQPGSYLVLAKIDHPDYSGQSQSILAINDTSAPVIPTFDSWKNQKFTNAERLDSNIASPNADPDQDGYNNLFEYAFGLDPKSAPTASEQAALPQMTRELIGDMATVAFELPVTAPADVTFIVEASPDLSSNSWLEISRRVGNGTWTGAASAFASPPANDRVQTLITESGLPRPKKSRFYRLAVVRSPL